jgi:hypothetical protein
MKLAIESIGFPSFMVLHPVMKGSSCLLAPITAQASNKAYGLRMPGPLQGSPIEFDKNQPFGLMYLSH